MSDDKKQAQDEAKTTEAKASKENKPKTPHEKLVAQHGAPKKDEKDFMDGDEANAFIEAQAKKGEVWHIKEIFAERNRHGLTVRGAAKLTRLKKAPKADDE